MSIETMKLALEALEFSDDFIGMEPFEHVAQEASEGHEGLRKAITALRQAIEQAQKQEPVAWVDAVMEQAQVFASAWSLVGSRFDNGNELENAEQAKAELRTMLTSPPQRQWVGLTDEEIDQGLVRTNYAMQTAGAWRDGVEWAQSQLKEKNT